MGAYPTVTTLLERTSPVKRCGLKLDSVEDIMASATKRYRKRRGVLLPDEELEVIQRQPIRNKRLLVINRNYQPIATCTLKSAINKLFNEAAVIILPPGGDSPIWQEFTWEDWAKIQPKEGESVLQAVRRAFKIPEIIKTLDYDGMHHRQQKLTRRGLFKRDNYTCQYCGKRAPDEVGLDDMGIDHVLARSRGGVTSWENCVLSCTDCNRKKDDRSLEEAHMKLLSVPKMPPYDILQGRMIRVDSWQHFLGDCYFNTPLKD